MLIGDMFVPGAGEAEVIIDPFSGAKIIDIPEVIGLTGAVQAGDGEARNCARDIVETGDLSVFKLCGTDGRDALRHMPQIFPALGRGYHDFLNGGRLAGGCLASRRLYRSGRARRRR